MKATDTLTHYGLDAFGVDASRASEKMASWVARHPSGQSVGASALSFCLQSLLQKMDAVDTGASSGFRMDDDEAEIADMLIECGTHFAVRRENSTLRRA